MNNNNNHRHPKHIRELDYECEKPWPEGWEVNAHWVGPQAHFEAFQKDPRGYIRGTGISLSRAEESAWRQYKQIQACPGHIFDNRGYDTGVGWCVHCDMFSSTAFEPTRTPCVSCGRPTAFFRDSSGGVWCMTHWREIPDEQRTDAWDVFYNRPSVLQGYIKEYRAKFKEPTV